MVRATQKHENLVHTRVGPVWPGAAMLGTAGSPQPILYIFKCYSCSVIRRMDVVWFIGKSWTIFYDASHHLTTQTRMWITLVLIQ